METMVSMWALEVILLYTSTWSMASSASWLMSHLPASYLTTQLLRVLNHPTVKVSREYGLDHSVSYDTQNTVEV